MRAGLPAEERRALRARILENALAQARIQASEVHLTLRCLGHLEHRAPRMNNAERMAEHALCKGESLGDGCLCPLHDPDVSLAQ